MRGIDDSLSDVASDVPASFDSKRGVQSLRGDLEEATDELTANIEADMDSLTPAGVGGVGGAADGGMGGGAAAGGAVALASRIPKPVAGVAAAAALPVALSGGVGLGMLSAMQSSSARLQTTAGLLGVAKDTFWRPYGNELDESIRPMANAILSWTQENASIVREQGVGAGIEHLLTGYNPAETGMLQRFTGGLGTGAGLIGGGFAGAKAGGALGATLGSVIPGAGTAAGGAAGAITGAIVGAIAAAPIGGRVGSAIGGAIEGVMNKLSWPEFPEFSWPNVSWPGWPDDALSWPGWPTLRSNDVLAETFGVQIRPMDIVGFVFPTIGAAQLVSEIVDGRGGGGGGGDDDGPFGWIPGLQSGGRVRQTGAANVHRGEMVGSPEQLVSELAQAVGDNGGGDSSANASMDTRALESKLDRLHRDLMNLRSAMDVTVQVGEETIARAATNGQQNRLMDTDPTV